MVLKGVKFENVSAYTKNWEWIYKNMQKQKAGGGGGLAASTLSLVFDINCVKINLKSFWFGLLPISVIFAFFYNIRPHICGRML